jgi:glycosyltransferase involved in cell wall biosynthesis
MKNEDHFASKEVVSIRTISIFMLKKILGKKNYQKFRTFLKGDPVDIPINSIKDQFSTPLKLYRQVALNLLLEKDVDLIFYTYFDFFTTDFLATFPEVTKMLEKPWVALIFDPRKEQIETLIKSVNCEGIGVVSEAAYKELKELTKVPVALISDFIPDYPSRFELNRENTKKTISLIGSLSKRKNLDLFVSAAFSKKGKDFNWLIYGQLDKNNLKFITKMRLNKLIYSKPKNIKFNFSYLSGTDFNEAINSTSIIFLAYENWPHASNLLTHATFNRIPVIASQGFEIGKLVNEFSLGILLRENNQKNLFQAIEALSEYVIPEASADLYLGKFSRKNFEKSILNLVSKEISNA